MDTVGKIIRDIAACVRGMLLDQSPRYTPMSVENYPAPRGMRWA